MLRSISRVTRKFRAINARYATPRIRISPAVRISLLVLRVYLVLLVGAFAVQIRIAGGKLKWLP